MRDDNDTAEFQKDFRQHLDDATETVLSWPSWKQSVLGRALGGRCEHPLPPNNQVQQNSGPSGTNEELPPVNTQGSL